MSKALCPGSFDPLTLGHIDIIKRCSNIFDEVIVLIGKNDQKKGLLSYDARFEYIKDAFKDISNVNFVIYDGLTIDFAFDNNVDVIVKGVRNSADVEYENEMANTNKYLSFDKYGKVIDTLFLQSSPENMYTSSSLVRQLISMNLPIDRYVHNPKLLFKLLGK